MELLGNLLVVAGLELTTVIDGAGGGGGKEDISGVLEVAGCVSMMEVSSSSCRDSCSRFEGLVSKTGLCLESGN